MKKSTEISLALCLPKAGQDALEQRLAQCYADAVIQTIRTLPCPAAQKLELLDAILESTDLSWRL